MSNGWRSKYLFLGGDVVMKASAEVKPVQEVNEMLTISRELELESARNYNLWANECGAGADSVSKKLFEDLVVDEERHYNQYDDEMGNMKKFGANYLALQSIERSKTRAQTSLPGHKFICIFTRANKTTRLFY